MLVGCLNLSSFFGVARGFKFSENRCYQSSFKSSQGLPILEVRYNLSEKYDARTSENDLKAFNLTSRLEPVYFRYDLATGRSLYLVSKEDLPALRLLDDAELPRLHPFTAHLALLSCTVETRRRSHDEAIEKVLAIEDRLFGSNTLQYDPRELHNITRITTVIFYRIRRDLSHISRLKHDMDRLHAKLATNPSCPQLDMDLHNRVKDGLLVIEVCPTKSCEGFFAKNSTEHL